MHQPRYCSADTMRNLLFSILLSRVWHDVATLTHEMPVIRQRCAVAEDPNVFMQ